MTFPRHRLISIGTALLAALLLCAPSAHGAEAVIAFLDAPEGAEVPPLEQIGAREELALGLMSATQGPYTVRQTLLDMSAGNRTSKSTYEPSGIPFLGMQSVGGEWRIEGWGRALERAETAYADVNIGLLAEEMGGAAFVAVEPAVEGVLAADRTGDVAAASFGPRSTLVDRVRRVAGRHRLVVTVLPGTRELDAALRRRPDGELWMVIRRPPRTRSAQLLPTGIAGLARNPSMLRSSTTHRDGFISATDVLPTIIDQGEDLEGVTGRRIEAVQGRSVGDLRRMERRLRVVYPRRFPALGAVLMGIGLAGLLLTLAGRRRYAMRVVALAVLWVPFVALCGAALAPSEVGEMALMGAGTIVLAVLTDRFVAWPRGPAVPALAGVLGYTADLFFGSYLTVRSLLGPNPRFGSRFYGVGNELEATLPVLALIGLAALLYRMEPGRRLAAAFGAVMVAFAAVLGAGRLGADVGGVITAGAAAAAAALVAYGRRPPTWALVLAAVTPVLALVALAVLDLLTGGDSHFAALISGDSAGFTETVKRRYSLAWTALQRGLMPLATVAAILLAVVAWRRREVWYAPVRDSRAWAAALLGGLAGGVVGTLTNDSGPVLLVLGCVVLAAATAYVRGMPETPPPGAGNVE